MILRVHHTCTLSAGNTRACNFEQSMKLGIVINWIVYARVHRYDLFNGLCYIDVWQCLMSLALRFIWTGHIRYFH